MQNWGFQLSKGHITCRPLLIFYPKPPWGVQSLHVDDATNNGSASRGGLLRDHNGGHKPNIFAFNSNSSNNLTETRALRDGLLLCSRLGVSRISIRSDSVMMVNWATNCHNILCNLKPCWRLTKVTL